jgi:hypothetical protein
MKQRGRKGEKAGVEQKVAATGVVWSYIVCAYAVWVGWENVWLRAFGEMGLLAVSYLSSVAC